MSVTEMRFLEAVRAGLREEMQRDENVFLCGEEIGRYQGTFRVTEGLHEEFGGRRVVDTPISEIGIAGLATGAAMVGLRPVAEFMTWSFALEAMDQIVNHAGKITYMSGGRIRCPVVFRGPAGVGTQLSAQHSQSLETWFAHAPGLKVAMPSSPADAKGLLKTAIRDDNPVVFMEHASLYGKRGPVPDDPDFTVPFGEAVVRREGTDCSLISWSRGVHLSMDAAKILEAEGVSCEVLDLRTLVPLDTEALRRTIARTHHAVVVHDDFRNAGFGAEVVARVQEEAFDDLDAPVLRVAGADVPLPYAKKLERTAIPSDQDIAAAVRRTLA